MNPTPRLRFVQRHVYENRPASNAYGDLGTVSVLVKKTVLQQWFAYDIEYPMTKGEWKDVPCETEQ
jgi:hypothetical protein